MKRQILSVLLALVAGLAMAVLAGGCVSHQANQPATPPTVADQVAAGEEAFETVAFAVGMWADLAGSPAERQLVEKLTDAGRAAIAQLKSDVAAGKPVDVFAVLRSVRAAAAELRQVKRAAGADVPTE